MPVVAYSRIRGINIVRISIGELDIILNQHRIALPSSFRSHFASYFGVQVSDEC